MRKHLVVVEGEASESEDEVEPKPAPEPPQNLMMRPPHESSKPRVHIDERLAQRWKILGADAATMQWRRCQAAHKNVTETLSLAESSFATFQSSVSKVRSLTDKFCDLESLFSQLALASEIIPAKISSNFTMPERFT